MNLEGIRIRLRTLSGAEQVPDCILSLKEEEKMATIGLLWSWWNARNKANAGEQRRSTDEVTFSARMAMISTANVKGPRPVSRGPSLQLGCTTRRYLENKHRWWLL